MATLPAHCKARRYNDEYNCHQCGLTWAVDDPDPPQCANAPAPKELRMVDPRPNVRAAKRYEKRDNGKITPEMWRSLRAMLGDDTP